MSSAGPSAARHITSFVGVLCVLLLAALLPGQVAAQGLGDAAGQERDRRKKQPAAPAQVFTNDDLSTPEEAPSEETEAEEAEDDETPELSKVGAADPLRAELDREREERALQEREWRARFAESRARVREEEARCWREVIRTEFHQGIPVQMKVQEFVESEELRQARQNQVDLEEEFRRSGHPPGWARE